MTRQQAIDTVNKIAAHIEHQPQSVQAAAKLIVKSLIKEYKLTKVELGIEEAE